MSGKPIGIGDVVVLRSGGPVMTIQERGRKEGHFICYWMDGCRLYKGLFNVLALRRATQNDMAPGVPFPFDDGR